MMTIYLFFLQRKRSETRLTLICQRASGRLVSVSRSGPAGPRLSTRGSWHSRAVTSRKTARTNWGSSRTQSPSSNWARETEGERERERGRDGERVGESKERGRGRDGETGRARERVKGERERRREGAGERVK